MKIINKIKNYRPDKYVRYLLFFIPLLLLATSKIDNDIWFLLNHGKYVIHNGIPTIEPFTMHQGFSFVMQQWLSAVIFYLVYSTFKFGGLIILVCIISGLFMYFVYKTCLLISDNKKYLSTLITILTTIVISYFFKTRPQIFTYLLLIIVLYIMELYRKNGQTKAIYFLPIISLLEINLHASMWFMLYLFILPYFLYFIKDKKIKKLSLIIILMIMFGFINPYGIKAITYVFNSLGNPYINNLVLEMKPPVINIRLGLYTFLGIGLLLTIYIINRQKLDFIYTCLFLGTLYLTLNNYRNYSLFIIATYPFLGYYLKDKIKDKKEIKDEKTLKYFIGTTLFLTIYLIILIMIRQNGFSNEIQKGTDILVEKNNQKEITLFCDYDSGGYLEYRGLRPYIDPRAEVFIKNNNKKEDIFKEYYLIVSGLKDYDKFIDKYNFTHMIIKKNQQHLYNYLKNNPNFHLIWENKDYQIYEKNDY